MISREVGKTIRESREEMEEFTADHFRRASEDVLRHAGKVLPSTQERVEREADHRRPGAGRRRRRRLAVELPGRHRGDPDRLRARGRLHRRLEAVRVAPLCANMFAEVLHDAGFPPARSTSSTAEATSAASRHPSSRSASVVFTGSSRTGEQVARDAGLKNRVLELGGNGPQIVLADADIEQRRGRCDHRLLLPRRPVLHGCRADPRPRVGEGPSSSTPSPERTTAPAGRRSRSTRRPTWGRSARRSSRAHAGAHRGRGREGCEGRPRRRPRRAVPRADDHRRRHERDADRSGGDFRAGRPIMTFRDPRRGDRDRQRDRVRTDGEPSSRSSLKDAWHAAEELRHGTVHINETTNYWDQLAPFGGAKKSGAGRELAGWIVDGLTETKQITFDLS